jgi:uncharacterized membrane protein
MRKWWALTAVVCLVLQVVAYNLSWLTATSPVHCIAWPFGECEHVMASGYASVLFDIGSRINLEAIAAWFVTFTLWLAIAAFVHGPARGKETKIFLVVWLLALLLSATRLTIKGVPVQVSQSGVMMSGSLRPRLAAPSRQRRTASSKVLTTS